MNGCVNMPEVIKLRSVHKLCPRALDHKLCWFRLNGHNDVENNKITNTKADPILKQIELQ